MLEPVVPPDVLDAIRAPFAGFGGERIDPPVLQPLSLLLDMTGEAMRSRLLVVSGGAEEEALRPDFTVPVVRAHLTSGRATGRYTYEGLAFRASPTASERPSEFLQIGAEAFGLGEDPAAEDAAMAAMAWRAASAGGRRDLAMQIGDVGLFRAFLTVLGAPEAVSERLARTFANPRAFRAELARAQASDPEHGGPQGDRLTRLLSDLPEGEAVQVLEGLWRLAGIQPVGGRPASEIVHRLALRADAARGPKLTAAEAGLIERFFAISGPPRKTLDDVEALAAEGGGDLTTVAEHWMRRLRIMTEAGAEETAMTLTTAFARPFGYYDGVLFEVRSAAFSPDEAVAAGGRYDGLPARLGGAPGAVGCVVRPGRAWVGAGPA